MKDGAVNLIDELKKMGEFKNIDEVNEMLNDDISNDQLLALWYKVQELQSDDEYKETSAVDPKDKNRRIEKDSFSVDGPIYPERYGQDTSEKKILFILKESHVNNEKLHIDEHEDKEINYDKNEKKFWFKREIIKDEKKEKCYKYVPMLKKICKYINEALPEDKIWNNVAYININKRGGFSQTQDDTFIPYIYKYRDYIKKQITILNPDIVVCCGSYGYLIKHVIFGCEPGKYFGWEENGLKDKTFYQEKNNNHIITYIDMYHPACIKSEYEFMSKFENTYHNLY